MNIIGFTGLARSGKSTASSFLENNYGFNRVNFKSAMIDEIKEIFPDFLQAEAVRCKCTIDNLFDIKPDSFRQFLQNYGTELRRSENENYWIEQWMAKANKRFIATDRPIVVDDVRFLNEADTIKRIGGIIIRVKKRGQDTSMSHQSETEMTNIIPDYEIEVDEGDIEDLCNKVREIYEDIK